MVCDAPMRSPVTPRTSAIRTAYEHRCDLVGSALKQGAVREQRTVGERKNKKWMWLRSPTQLFIKGSDDQIWARSVRILRSALIEELGRPRPASAPQTKSCRMDSDCSAPPLLWLCVLETLCWRQQTGQRSCHCKVACIPVPPR